MRAFLSRHYTKLPGVVGVGAPAEGRTAGDEWRPHVVYIAASGDIVASYENWRSGSDADHEGALSYSAGVFGAIQSTGATALCLSPGPAREPFVDEGIVVENIPPLKSRGGLAYYLAWLRYSLRLVFRLIREKPDILFLSDRVIFYPCLLPLHLRGTRIVHILHMAPRNVFQTPSKVRRIVLAMELAAMRRFATAAFGLYGRVADQLREELAPSGVQVEEFLPIWPLDALSAIPVANHAAGPFRIFFIGRAEPSKGVFDLLEAFEQVARKCNRPVRLDYFGDGSAMQALREMVSERGLGGLVTLHGQCGGSKVREHLPQAHLIVVPTRTEFVEGLNKVVIEGLLAGRPVVSSPVCPSVELVPDTAILATPDDPASYAEAIARLASDPQAYAAATQGRERLPAWLVAHHQPLGDRVGDLIVEAVGLEQQVAAE